LGAGAFAREEGPGAGEVEEGGNEVVHWGRDGVGYILAYKVEGVALGGGARAGAGAVLLNRAHGGSLWLGYLTGLKPEM
jgi:hypothetical protein